MTGYLDPLVDDEDPDPILVGLMVGQDLGTLDALEALINARPAWHADAACRGVGPEVFYIERGRSVEPAYKLCASCPVARPCLDDALDRADRHGIWGGINARRRPAMRRERAS